MSSGDIFEEKCDGRHVETNTPANQNLVYHRKHFNDLTFSNFFFQF